MIELNLKSTYVSKLRLTTDADLDSGDYQVYATVSHEWGDIVVAEDLATRTAAGRYEYSVDKTALNSSGVFKVSWRYIINDDEFEDEEFFSISAPYIQDFVFFDAHPELEDEFGDKFIEVEQKVRGVIDTFCGQSFQPYNAKTLTLDGDNSATLYLPVRLDKVTEVLEINSDNGETDITALTKIANESKFFLEGKARRKFKDTMSYAIKGNWGWPYVPQNISKAASLLIEDTFNDDSSLRVHGISLMDMDTHSIKLHDTIFESTGNLDADLLLMDYTRFLLEMI